MYDVTSVLYKVVITEMQTIIFWEGGPITVIKVNDVQKKQYSNLH